MSSPNGYALSRSRTLKPGRRHSSNSSSADEQEDRDDQVRQSSTFRTPSRGFGLSEDDLLQSTEEGEIEVIETTILKPVTSQDSLYEEGRAVWADSDDEIEVVETTQQAEMLVLGDSASDQGDSASDMQLDDDDEEEQEDPATVSDLDETQPIAVTELSEQEDDDNDVMEVESDHELSDIAVDEDEGYEEDIVVQQQASRSPSPQLGLAREDSPIVVDITVLTEDRIEETKASPLKTQRAQEETSTSTSEVDLIAVSLSPAPQRLPSPVSPEQVSSRPLDDSPPPNEPSPELEAPPSTAFRPFPPSQIKPKGSLFSGGFFKKLRAQKALSSTTSTRAEQGSRCGSPFDGTAASVLSFAALDDEVGSQASHLPSPTSSVDLDYEDAVDDVEEDRNPWASAGDWGTSIFKAAEEDSAAASEQGAEDSAAASEQGAESRDKSVSPLHEDDLPLEYQQAVSDDDEEEEQDDFGATDELDLDIVPDQLAHDEWFDKETLNELDDIFATLEAECPNCTTSANQVDDLFDTPRSLSSPTRKRTFSSTDMATSTELVSTVDASVNTVSVAQSASADTTSLSIAPLPKRRRIVRDLGHVTLGFGLGVVAAVAGLSALSGAIQAMDV
ncbi:hypothetical protein BCR35DRAFT_127320 [Leucosporidium creatinivorum]|uniref:Uncharacterized protein n=1 Tax=Leucosporidium creatinivorum TaxID=106004 RepID=A0A1Y2EX38_9BASI|nr:hypothetical protein BCR35DRAFT_127320 [Leucosporidium creatinivorum]